jgi:glutamyl-tRNA synthetase
MQTTRLAPSPTGALHLGNARTFLINWLMARQNGWRVVLRIEDLDGPRIKFRASQELIDDLCWLGMDWDEGPVVQSTRRLFYRPAIEELIRRGDAYPCICTRKEIELAASAPHAEDGSSVYPGTCRGRFTTIRDAVAAAGKEPAIRFRVPKDRIVSFTDSIAGPREYDVARQLGDFVISKADGTPGYQLAVVVDDAAMNVTDVVRGDDLLDSTPRQILVYEALGLIQKIPTYHHLPLIVGRDGRRLAKRHGDTRLSFYREASVEPERLVALLARWSGMKDVGNRTTAKDLLGRFDVRHMPREATVFTADDDAWLLSTIGTPKTFNPGRG